MSLAHNVSAASARHDSILSELSSLDYVPSALAQATSYFDDVTRLVTEAAQRLDEAELAKKKEMKEHHDMQGANVRRALSKIVGRGEKWKQKATKEEREFLEALENEMKQKHELEALQATQKEAKQRVTELGSATSRREALQRELEDLYGRVFDGPTPDAPLDDRLECELRAADDENNRNQAILSHEAKVLELLGKAHGALSYLIMKMSEAKGHSTTDMWGFGGPIPDMFEAEAVDSAHGLHRQVLTHMDQARRMSPAVGPLPKIEIPENSMMDLYFDNIFTDMAQHKRISDGLQSAREAYGVLTYEVTRGKARVDAAAERAATSFAALSRARSALHDFRRETFQSIAHHGPTPAYGQAPSPLSHTADRGLPHAGSSYQPPSGPPDAASSHSPPNAASNSHLPPGGPPLTTSSYLPPEGPPPVSPTGRFHSPSAANSYPPPEGPPPAASFCAPPQGPPPAGSSHPPVAAISYSPPPGPPPLFPTPSPFVSQSPAQSGGGGPTLSSTNWQSMNPYAALLVRRGTREGDELSAPKNQAVTSERIGG